MRPGAGLLRLVAPFHLGRHRDELLLDFVLDERGAEQPCEGGVRDDFGMIAKLGSHVGGSQSNVALEAPEVSRDLPAEYPSHRAELDFPLGGERIGEKTVFRLAFLRDPQRVALAADDPARCQIAQDRRHVVEVGENLPSRLAGNGNAGDRIDREAIPRPDDIDRDRRRRAADGTIQQQK